MIPIPSLFAICKQYHDHKDFKSNNHRRYCDWFGIKFAAIVDEQDKLALKCLAERYKMRPSLYHPAPVRCFAVPLAPCS